MGLSRLRLAGHVLFFLLPGNGYVKVLEELAVEKTSGSNKSLAMTVVAKVAFSKERDQPMIQASNSLSVCSLTWFISMFKAPCFSMFQF